MESKAQPSACPRCGADLPTDSLGGVCSGCALGLLLKPDGDERSTIVLSLGDIRAIGTSLTYIGDYELLEVIAHGGMGVVYKARQKSLNRIVALKLLLGGAHASADFRKRFRHEAELAAQLHHPNIVPIHEAGEHEGQPYFSMEYVPGQDLASLTRGTPLPPQQAVEYLKTIAEAVHYAHLQGVLHRDLKPSNVLLGSDGRLRITDFGLAKRFADASTLTLSGATLGTPGYLPPEQISIKRGTVGVTSDVYSLGAILFHLLTGHAPFRGESAAEVLMQVLNEPPVPPSESNPLVPPELDRICLKSLAKDPSKRFPSAKGLAHELEGPLIFDLRREARMKSSAFRLSGAKRAALVGLAALLLIGAAWFWLGRSKPPAVWVQTGRRTNSLGMVFVPVPNTKVLFSIWDTRVQDFAAFVKETGYAATNGMFSRSSDGWKQSGDSWLVPGFPQGPTHPVCGVSWEDATAFCDWLTAKERRAGKLSHGESYRLPTDSEWSTASGLGPELGESPMEKSRKIDNVYPWGNQWPPPVGIGNYGPRMKVDDFTWTSPVGSFSANPFGLYDMGGNVNQWCHDWSDTRQMYRVKRGSSWLCSDRTNAVSSVRHRDTPDYRIMDNGFRVVLDLGEQPRLAAAILAQQFTNAQAIPVPTRLVEWVQWRKSQGGNDHYYARTSRALAWEEAEADAQKLDGHLVAIGDAAEQRFLETEFLAGDFRLLPLWIGLKLNSSGEDYEWSNGEPVVYTNWQPGEPSRMPFEIRVCLNWFFSKAPGSDRFGTWNDVPSGGPRHGERSDGPYYGIVEREANFTEMNRVRWTNSLGMVFVPVPGTEASFCIWKTRVQDFAAFVKETGYDATERTWSARKEGWKQWGDSWLNPGFKQEKTHPVCGVSWDDAHAFCEWLTLKEQQAGRMSKDQEYRLPTDAEWSAAVGKPKYPWGESWPPPSGAGNYGGTEVMDENYPKDWPGSEGFSDRYAQTSPVGAFGSNHYGLYDLGGNLWEWCEDWYRKEMNSEEARRLTSAGDDGGGKAYRVQRGGSWHSTSNSLQLQSGLRNRILPGSRAVDTGFRCVLAVKKHAPGPRATSAFNLRQPRS